MIFEKEAITIQEEAEKIAQVVTVMAHQGTRYTLENKSLYKPATPNKVGRYRLRRRTLCGRRSGKRPRLANSLATSQHYRDRRFDVSKLLRIHSYHLLASASPLVTKRKH